MKIEGLDRIVRSHPFFADLREDFLTLVCGCAKNVRFEAGQYLFREGEPADAFYLIRHGRVALQLTAPGRGTLTLATHVAGELVGVSWLIPPYRWGYDGKALDLVRAIAIDGACLRGKCESDHDFGYEMMKRFAPLLVRRLHAARMQSLDVYGRHA